MKNPENQEQEQNKAAELSQALGVPEEAIISKGSEFVDGLYEAMKLVGEYMQALGVEAPADGAPQPGQEPAVLPATEEGFIP
jgi:hypothetical protein